MQIKWDFSKALLVLACHVFALSACTEPTPFHGTDISMVEWGKDFKLNDSTGKARQLSDFRGKAVVLFFGYTQCPDVCPTTLAALREAMNLLGEKASRVQVLFISVDPERDKPELLAQYVPAFHPSFLGLSGDVAATAALAKDFKVFYAKQPGSTPATYSVDHSTQSYVYDPTGRLRLLIQHGETPANIAADLSRLLDSQ